MNRTALANAASVVATAVAIALAQSASAGSSTSVVVVSAAVRPSAVFNFDLKTAPLAITWEDISAGYVELPATSFLATRTGRPDPEVFIEFTPVAGVFSSVEIKTETSWQAARRRPEVRTVAANVDDAPSAETPADASTAISYRLNLAPGVVPGSYALPMTLNINL
jgi:hypothetical protein